VPGRVSERFPWRTAWLVLCLGSAAASGVATDEHPSEPSVTLEEMLVTGERPGPGMWRISKADHDLWILATLEPLPKKMTWRSAAVESRIAASQVVLSPPEVTADIGFFRGLTLVPSLLRAKKSPDGQTLEQILPHDLYIRWLALRVKYLGRSGDEQLRPMLAALDLYLHALDASGLTSDDSVWKVVEENSRQHRVRIEPVVATLKLKDPKASIRDLDQIPRDAEIACLRKTMERIETDLPGMRQRANLWSLGDVAGLRALPFPDERIECLDAFFSVPELRDQLQTTRTQLEIAWLAAAGAALDRHQSSFAVLPLNELVSPDGYLARLRTAGYAVEEPRP
jgi:uncharacterized protein YbaP (TraB family)